jgi:predicted nucleic acid-binding protein
MAKINIDNHVIGFSDSYFFDTNVWLLLFGTIADFQKYEQKKYSQFFSNIIEKEKPIYITSLICSEFSNVLLRRDFKLWEKENSFHNKDFKRDFVGTDKYKSSVYSIKLQMNKILSLPNLIKIGDSFHILNFDNIFSNFDLIDFNDSYYAEVCRVNNYKMVTNDKDFLLISDSINIITAL